ncbi:MAG TPA: cell division protein FtsK, partial [Methylothermaceae bacterium]|nr:cell division protein FtsK [Methylothermaceae bacterium]
MDRLTHGLREVGLLCCLAVALYFLVSLLSFDLEDPGWRHTGAGRPLTNAGGLVGAWLADFSLTLLGVMAFLLPVMIAWHGWTAYRNGRLWGDTRVLGVRWLGLLLTMVSGAGIGYVHFPRAPLDLPETSGGVLGVVVGEWLLNHFGVLGATLALLVAFLTGMTLLTGLSWLNLMELIGKYVLWGWELLWNRLRRSLSKPTKPRFQSDGEGVRRVIRRQEPSIAVQEVEVEPAKENPEPPVSVIPETTSTKPVPVVKPAGSKADKAPVIGRKAIPRKAEPPAPSEPVLPSLDLLDEGNGQIPGYSKEDLAL